LSAASTRLAKEFHTVPEWIICFDCVILNVMWVVRLRQKELQDERISDALHEAEKPLARYSDDADLDARLREQEREGDTMLAYIRKKKEKGITKSKSFAT